MDLLQQAAAWLDGQRAAHLSHPVTYCRGQSSAEVSAAIGKTVFEIVTDYGAERFESRDFLISAATLQMEPATGDRIKETQGSKVYVYEVMAPGKEPCWRWSDPFRLTYRVHTKLVDTE